MTTVAISGATSTGKTTFIALLLETVIKHAPIPVIYINEDAFFKEVPELPVVDDIPDNDALESLHMSKLRETIQYAQHHHSLPKSYQPFPWLERAIKDARKSLPEPLVTKLTQRLHEADIDWSKHKALFFVEGFLLYHQQPESARLLDFFDYKLFFLASFEEAKRRRMQKYIDHPLPPDSPSHFASPAYFDRFVWGHYVNYHKYLFGGEEGKGSRINRGELDVEQARIKYGLYAPDHPDMDLESSLTWAFEAMLVILKATA